METISFDRFGRDHWGVLLLVEAECVNRSGKPWTIDNRRMRVHPNKAPFHPQRYRGNDGYSDKYPTRLRDGTEVSGHDDWDCLEDLEAAGLLHIHSLVNGVVQITRKGQQVAAQARAWRSQGHGMVSFVPEPVEDDRSAVGLVMADNARDFFRQFFAALDEQGDPDEIEQRAMAWEREA